MILKDKNLYYVGGVVRDEILGAQSLDTDFCYEGDAIEFAKSSGLNIIKENPSFGTVRVLYNGKEIDIASTREETYPEKGHLPVVKNTGCSLKEDLKRRDFTVNAMAKNTISGEITDYFGGMKDIKNKTLRVLHDNSFIDDPTRIVRALKFSVRFGFELDSHSKSLQQEYLENINYDMSYHRLKKELIETFNLNNGEAFDKFIENGIYKLISPNADVPKIKGFEVQKAVNDINTNNPFIIYMGILRISDSPIPYTRSEKRILEWAERLKYQEITNHTPKESILIHNLIERAYD